MTVSRHAQLAAAARRRLVTVDRPARAGLGLRLGSACRRMQRRLTPEVLLRAYAGGIFPMAETAASADLHWIDPLRRGIIPLDGFHLSRSLARRLRRAPYRAVFDRDFAATVAACADRPETWINAPLAALYAELHQRGFAHSVELWEGDVLVGGVFGIALGGAFFGESMFSRRTDASKMALAYLVSRLRCGGFALFDVQFLTPHLARLGAQEIPRAAYRARLQAALTLEADFHRQGRVPSPESVILHCRSQMS